LAGLFVCVVRKEEDSMIIRSPEPKVKILVDPEVKILVDPEVKILVDRDPIKTSFEQWAPRRDMSVKGRIHFFYNL